MRKRQPKTLDKAWSFMKAGSEATRMLDKRNYPDPVLLASHAHASTGWRHDRTEIRYHSQVNIFSLFPANIMTHKDTDLELYLLTINKNGKNLKQLVGRWHKERGLELDHCSFTS